MFAYMIFIINGQDQIYLANETERTSVVDMMVIVQGLDQTKSYSSRSRSAEVL